MSQIRSQPGEKVTREEWDRIFGKPERKPTGKERKPKGNDG